MRTLLYLERVPGLLATNVLMFKQGGWEVEYFSKALGARKVIEDGLEYDAAIIDISQQVENENGLQIVGLSKHLHPTVPVVTTCPGHCRCVADGKETDYVCEEARRLYDEAGGGKLDFCPRVLADAHFVANYTLVHLLITLDKLAKPEKMIEVPEKNAAPETPSSPDLLEDSAGQPPA